MKQKRDDSDSVDSEFDSVDIKGNQIKLFQ